MYERHDPRGRILLVGGSRFVGPATLYTLQRAGYEITVLNRGTRPISGVNQLVADRNDQAQFRAAINSAGEFDAVIDLSCYTPAQAGLATSLLFPKTKHWIHLSSAAVYSDSGLLPSESAEAVSAEAWGRYGHEKAAADELLMRLKGGPPTTILRPPYLYGPRNPDDREAFLWARLLRGRPILLPRDDEVLIQLLHVQDLADAILAVVSQRAEGTRIFNVGPGEDLSLRGYVELLANICGAAWTRVHPSRLPSVYLQWKCFPLAPVACRVDDTRFRCYFKWRPHFGVRSGLAAHFESLDRSALAVGPIDTTEEDKILGFGWTAPRWRE